MEKRILGNTGLETTVLCYGCAAAYARELITDQKAIELFTKAYNNGISFFDTGHSYGKAEERIGKALRWRFRSKGPQKTDDYFGVKPPKKDPIINKKGRELGSRASIFRSIATQLS